MQRSSPVCFTLTIRRQPSFHTTSYRILQNGGRLPSGDGTHFSVPDGLRDDDTIGRRRWWWGKPAIYMSQVYCNVSVCAPLPAQRTDCSAKGLNSVQQLRASCSGTLRSHSSYTTQGQNALPPPTHRHRNTHIWSKLTCHSTFNNHRLHVGRLRNHQPGLFLLLLLLFFFFFLKQSVLQPCEVTERHLQ